MAKETPQHAGEAGELPTAEAAEAVHGHEVAAGASEVAEHGGEGGGLEETAGRTHRLSSLINGTEPGTHDDRSHAHHR